MSLIYGQVSPKLPFRLAHSPWGNYTEIDQALCSRVSGVPHFGDIPSSGAGELFSFCHIGEGSATPTINLPIEPRPLYFRGISLSYRDPLFCR